ncbi:UNKNOWN [Stylonychia lemnae]|uniref:Radial spoke head protein 9 homolog n=1 Tax=Stylonychia lemnae TaxID=5949 RepID=A0A078A5Y9_STYLE|nr:UNKNOWN [Stylonychia lemnae]|eukprot:CDW77660.1 UNKNOWN [Stylonychia lemnae]
MDILDIHQSLKYLQHNGVGLNIEERIQLDLGLQQLLTHQYPKLFEELLYWGKIIGINADYHIAVGIDYSNHYEFPHKKFYYALSTNFQFKPFPALNDQHKDEYNKIKTLILGVPDKVHKIVEPVKQEGEEQQEENQQQVKEVDPLASSESEDEAAKIVPVNLKEIDRVHYLVRAIENDCHIIPQGSFKLTNAHEVNRNEAFRGLNLEEAFRMNSYQHFRNVQQKDKKEGLEKDDAIFIKNFLDDITADKPTGQWSVQKDSSGRVAILRNLQWPGFFAYHKANSKIYGSVYIGEGLKNADLPFML